MKLPSVQSLFSRAHELENENTDTSRTVKLYSLEWFLSGVQPDVLDERLLPLEHAVAVRALEVGRLVLQVVLPELARVAEALLTNLAEMPKNDGMQLRSLDRDRLGNLGSLNLGNG